MGAEMKIICLVLLLLCSGCTLNYVSESSNVNVSANKDIKVTDPSTTIGLPVL